MDGVAVFLGRATCKQGAGDTHLGQLRRKALVVLCSKDFRRCHKAGLETIIERHEHREGGHHRLTTTHVALQKAIHLLAAAYVGTDLFQHTLLRVGQVERDAVAIEAIEMIAYVYKLEAAVLLMSHAEGTNEVELQIEKLLELQAELSISQVLRIGRKMDLTYCLIVWHEVQLLNDIGGQRLMKSRRILL